MPCNSITTQSVNLKNAFSDLVVEAMTASRWVVYLATTTQVKGWIGASQVTWVKGQGLSIRGYQGQVQNQKTLNEITKAYSVAAVTWAAKRAGWQVQQTAADKLTVSRR